MALIALDHLAFFDGLGDAELNLLRPYFHSSGYPANSSIFEQGKLAEHLYLVIYGEVIIHYKPDDGPEMVVTRVPPGGVFGWSAALGNVEYTSGAYCEEECEVLHIKGSDLRTLCSQHPEVGKIILDRLSAVIAQRWESRKIEVTSILSDAMQTRVQPLEQKEEYSMSNQESDPQQEQMKALVEQLSAYIEHFHGGSVEFVSFDGKHLKVRLGGACLGCPLSPSTLHGWVEGTVRQFFPDIESVEPV
jgi:CRP-like cAMP-binding protein